jgi:O-antigen/teichoic acid export membrane protein
MSKKVLRTFFSNIVARLGYFGLLRLSGFIALPFWAGLIAPEQLALIAVIATIPKLCIIVCGCGTDIIVSKIIFRYSLKRCYKYIFSFLVVSLIVWCFVASALLVGFTSINHVFFQDQITLLAWALLLLAGGMQIIIDAYSMVVQSKLYAREYFIVTMLQTVAQSWVFVGFAFWLTHTYKAYVYSIFVINLVLVIYAMLKFYVPTMRLSHMRLKIMRIFFMPSFPAYISGILNWIKTSLDNLIFSHMGFLTVLGEFTMAKRLASPYDEIQRAIRQPAMYSFAANYEKDNDSSKISEVSNLFYFSMILVLFVYDEAMRWYATLFISSTYTNSLSFLVFILTWYLLRDLQVFYNRIALKHNNYIFAPITTSLVAILASAAYIVTIPRYGIYGAVYSLVFVEAVVGIAGGLYLLKKYRIDFGTVKKIISVLIVFFILLHVQNNVVIRLATKGMFLGLLGIFLMFRWKTLVPHSSKLVKQFLNR